MRIEFVWQSAPIALREGAAQGHLLQVERADRGRVYALDLTALRGLLDSGAATRF